MALQAVSYFSQADTVVTDNDGEFWGGAEPYLWGFHWKVDGESLAIRVKISLTPDNNNIVEMLDVSPEFKPSVYSPAGSHGNILSTSIDDEYLSGVPFPIPNRTGRYEGVLHPIPLYVNFELPDSFRLILDLMFPDGVTDQAIIDLLSDGSISSLVEALNVIAPGMFDLDLSALADWWDDADGDACPGIGFDEFEGMLEHMSAEFIGAATGGIPGMGGSIYVLMEQDLWSEAHAENVRLGFKTWLEELLGNVVNSISLLNLIPDPSPYEEYIMSDATITLVTNMYLPLFERAAQLPDNLRQIPSDFVLPPFSETILLDRLTRRISAIKAGMDAALGIIDGDDIVLVYQNQFSHDQLLELTDASRFVADQQGIPEFVSHGIWRLNGRLGLR